MNGNELADILRGLEGWSPSGHLWSEGGLGMYSPEGQLYSQHPELYKRDLPKQLEKWYGEQPAAQSVRGLQMSREEKTLSEELADILKRPEVKMLDPLQRADLIERIQKAQAAIAKREEEREKHEAEMLEIGRQEQMQEKIQAILRSDRVPAQKATALWMAGVPLSEAREMVWGKREVEEAPTRAREEKGLGVQRGSERRVLGAIESAEAGRISGAELAAILSAEGYPTEIAEKIEPSPPRGVQVRTVEGELITEPIGGPMGRRISTPEELEAAEKRALTRQERLRAEEKEVREKAATWWEKKRQDIAEATEKDRERAEEEAETRNLRIKEIDELGRELATQKYNRRIEKIKYEDGKKDIERKYEDSKIKYGDEKATAERNYNVKVLQEMRGWTKTLHDMGFEDENVIKAITKFSAFLDPIGDKTEMLAEGLEFVIEENKEGKKQATEELGIQMKKLYEEIDIAGIEESEDKIAMLAYLQFRLDAEELGRDAAIAKWRGIIETGGWYFGPEDLPLKRKANQDTFREVMKYVVDEATKGETLEVAGKVFGKTFEKDLQNIMKNIKKEKKVTLELPDEFKSVMSKLTEGYSKSVMDALKSCTNSKTGEWEYDPSSSNRDKCIDFITGRDIMDLREDHSLLPVNLSDDEYIMAIMEAPELSRKLQGWAMWVRFMQPALWGKMEDMAASVGKLTSFEEITPTTEEEVGGTTWEWFKEKAGVVKERVEEWWPFGKEEKIVPGGTLVLPEETRPKSPTGNIREDANVIGERIGITMTRPQLRRELEAIGWTIEDITAAFGGGW